MRAPLKRARSISPSRTSRALLEAGKSLPLSCSSASGMPTSSSIQRRCCSSGHERRILRSELGDDAVKYCDGSIRDGSTLQRPPPLIRILRPPSRVRSSSSTGAPACAAKIAAVAPAAPAPITTMGSCCWANAFVRQRVDEQRHLDGGRACRGGGPHPEFRGRYDCPRNSELRQKPPEGG